MGSTNSSPVYRELDRAIPRNKYSDNGPDAKSVFARSKDRRRFIEAIIVIMSDNARIDLERYEFKFIFLPRPDNSNRLVARIVALEDDKIVLKLESRWDGPTQFDAFWKFRRHVESEFDRILKAVPTVSAGLKGRTASGVSTGATASAASAAPSNRGVSGAPPAYSKN